MASYKLKSILLVDDDEMSNLLNKVFIEKLNLDLEVDVALNGQEALNFLLGRSVPKKNLLLTPCLLLLDINMPLMDGWEFLEQYDKLVPVEIKNQIVIVMLTISKEQNDKVKALNNQNIREFVEKPLSEATLKGLIDRHFAVQENYRPA